MGEWHSNTARIALRVYSNKRTKNEWTALSGVCSFVELRFWYPESRLLYSNQRQPPNSSLRKLV